MFCHYILRGYGQLFMKKAVFAKNFFGYTFPPPKGLSKIDKYDIIMICVQENVSAIREQAFADSKISP